MLVETACLLFCVAVFYMGYIFPSKNDTNSPASDRLIVITGCDSGFGALLATTIASKGFIVIAACLTQAAADELTRTDGTVVGVAGDLTKSVQPLLDTITSLLSKNSKLRLWAVVNNAGICLPGNAEWLNPSSYERTFAINFHVPVKLTYELLPLLKLTKNARLINVTSVDGFIALPSNAAYNSSKHALEAFSDTLRCEMLPWNVLVCVIEPATMRTPMALSFMDGWLKSFDEAPANRTDDVYSREWATKLHKQTSVGIANIAEDPMVTVKEVMHACMALNPKTRYKCGFFAKTLFTVLSHLPDKTRDSVLYSMTFPVKPKNLPLE
jgi:NAD(P)-dependent dehydrogenase (short-subunit alcohol dehydrogenase family)